MKRRVKPKRNVTLFMLAGSLSYPSLSYWGFYCWWGYNTSMHHCGDTGCIRPPAIRLILTKKDSCVENVAYLGIPKQLAVPKIPSRLHSTAGCYHFLFINWF